MFKFFSRFSLGTLNTKNSSPQKYQKGMEIEFEETLLDVLVQKRDISLKKLELPLSSGAFLFLRGIFLCLLGLFLLKAFQLQILERDRYASLAAQNFLVEFQIRPDRGIIYDRNFVQLVFNKSTFDLFLDKRLLPRDSVSRTRVFSLAAKIAKLSSEDSSWAAAGKSVNDVERLAEEGHVLVEPFITNLSHEQLLLWEKEKAEMPGFFLVQNSIRQYPDGHIFSHIIGYTSRVNAQDLQMFPDYSLQDVVGRTGIERAYEKILRGTSGMWEEEKTARGIARGQRKIRDAEAGKGVVLWLDEGLQKTMTEALQKTLRTTGTKKAAAIAVDPRSGGVLAFQSLPSFDNNLFVSGISPKDLEKVQQDPLQPLFPRVIAGQYPTGSTIKPFIAAAALQEGIISEKTPLFAPLELCLKNIYTGEKECFGDWTFHGWTDVKRAIAESVNPFFYIIGGGYKKNEFSDPRLPDSFEGLGVDRIRKYLSFFGFGEKTGIALPGEEKGRIPTPEWKKNYFSSPRNQIWRIGDTYNLSIGQGYLTATPLQVAMAFSAIANGGKLLKPQLVQKIVDQQRNTIEEIPPEVLREGFINEEHLRIVREGMRQAVQAGSARYLADLPISSAAKTGTAQISENSNLYYNWVTVFAPYENPEIVITVVVEDVEGLQAAALPVAKDILLWYNSNRFIKKGGIEE